MKTIGQDKCLRNVICFILVVLFSFSSVMAERRLVALFDFEFKAVTDSSTIVPENIGESIADMLVTELVKEGTYTVIERNRMRKIMEEQNMTHSDKFDPNTAAIIGKLLGVDAIIVGSITEYGLEKSTTGNLKIANDLYGGVNKISTHQQKGVVALDAHIIDVKTGVILGAANAKGEEKRSALTSDPRRDYNLEKGEHKSFSDVWQQLIGTASSKAVMDLTFKLVDFADNVRMRKIEGLVAYVDNDIVIINVGREHGISIGDEISIEQFKMEIKDPSDPTKILKRLTTPIARASVIELDETSAVCSIIEIYDNSKVEIGNEIKLVESH